MALLVRHVMAEEPRTASPDMNAYDAAGLMASYDIGIVPIVDGDRFIGVVTDRDLVVRVLGARENPMETRLGDIATTRELVTVTPDMKVAEARDLMAEHQVRRLPVVKDDTLVGMIALGDIAHADASPRAVGEALRDVSASPATTDVNAGGPDPGTPDRALERREEEAS
jgi:CBS domain-containing protein